MRLPFIFYDTNRKDMSIRKSILLPLAATLLLTACYNEGTLVNNPAPLMHYQHKPTQVRLLALCKTYAEAINNNLDARVIHPGQYADYGIVLAQLGCLKQANVMFNNEKTFFPNSSKYVDFLKQTYTPKLAADNHFDTCKIDLKSLDTIKVEYTPEELAQQQQLEADPEYQKMLKQQQLEEKEAKVLAAKKAKAERAKAKEAERKALAKEKEKAKREKAEAKKAEQRAKEEAKKAAERERAEAKKAEQRAKEEAKKAELEAKRAAEKAAAEAKKAEEKAQKEAEKAAVKAQREAEKAAKQAEKEAKRAAKNQSAETQEE